MLRRNSLSAVGDVQNDLPPFAAKRHVDRRAVGRIACGVLEKVADDEFHQSGIDRRDRDAVAPDGNRVRLEGAAQVLDALVDDIPKIGRTETKRQASRLDPGHPEKIAHQPVQPGRLVPGGVEQLAPVLRRKHEISVGPLGLSERAEDSGNRRERRPEFVRDGTQQRPLKPLPLPRDLSLARRGGEAFPIERRGRLQKERVEQTLRFPFKGRPPSARKRQDARDGVRSRKRTQRQKGRFDRSERVGPSPAGRPMLCAPFDGSRKIGSLPEPLRRFDETVRACPVGKIQAGVAPEEPPRALRDHRRGVRGGPGKIPGEFV